MTPFLASLSRPLIAFATACCAGSSWLPAISFSARVRRVLVALLRDLFLSRFLSDVLAVFSADILLGNRISFLRTKARFGLVDSCSAYNTTNTLYFRK